MKKRNFLKVFAGLMLIPFTPKKAKSFTGDALDHKLSPFEMGAEAQFRYNIKSAMPDSFWIKADEVSFCPGDIICPKGILWNNTRAEVITRGKELEGGILTEYLVCPAHGSFFTENIKKKTDWRILILRETRTSEIDKQMKELELIYTNRHKALGKPV